MALMRDVLIEILKSSPDDSGSKDLLERTRDILNGYDTIKDNGEIEDVSAKDVTDKIDAAVEMSSMEKYLAMVQGTNTK
tara:strand:- start:560 stop:796 length:237 start_codon:yes stop_codon:yes gene_type:complete